MFSGNWIDYFVFREGFCLDRLPDFVIGRVYWDQWLAWKAKSTGAKLVDASRSVTAIHQNHDCGDHANGKAGVVRCTVAEELQTGWRTVAPLHH